MYSFVTDSNGTEPWIRPLLSQNSFFFVLHFFYIPSIFVTRKIQCKVQLEVCFLRTNGVSDHHTAQKPAAVYVLYLTLRYLWTRGSFIKVSSIRPLFVWVLMRSSVVVPSLLSQPASLLKRRGSGLAFQSPWLASQLRQRGFPYPFLIQAYSFLILTTPKSTTLSYCFDTNNHCCWHSS
jgi:hypothetical protein